MGEYGSTAPAMHVARISIVHVPRPPLQKFAEVVVAVAVESAGCSKLRPGVSGPASIDSKYSTGTPSRYHSKNVAVITPG